MGSLRRVKLLNRQIKAMCNLCVGDDLFLPCPAENSTSEKKERLPHPFRYTTKRKDKSYLRKSKSKPTQHLSSAAFLDEIRSYLRNAARADCCVSVRGEARSCNCLQLLANKPNIVDFVALVLQMHFDLDKSNKKCQLVTKKRYAGRLTKESNLGKSPKPFQLPMFGRQFTGE